MRYGLACLVGILATLVAGAVGGTVIHVAMQLSFDETTVRSLPGMVVAGILLSSLPAAPVTLGVLPLLAVSLRRLKRGRWPVWLSAGLVAGAIRVWLWSDDLVEGAVTSNPFVSLVAAGAIAGLSAGALFAWLLGPMADDAPRPGH